MSKTDALHAGWRTSAYAWMWENFDAMVIRRGYWIGLAQSFVAADITRPDKTHYSADVLRKTYARVKKDKAITEQRTAARPSERNFEKPGHPAVSQVVEEPTDNPYGFKFTTVKGSPKQ